VAATAACSGLRPVAKRVGGRLRNHVHARRSASSRAGPARSTMRQSRCSARLASRDTCAGRFLSENQYDAKFIAAARTRARTRPWLPPRLSPSKRNTALIAPSSTAVFTAFMASILLGRGRPPFGSASYNPDMPAVILLLAAVMAAQAPAAPPPFPRPAAPTARPGAPPVVQPAPAPATAAPSANGQPSEATLGVPVYPGAQYLAAYDAGRGQKFFLFGTTASFIDIVTF